MAENHREVYEAVKNWEHETWCNSQFFDIFEDIDEFFVAFPGTNNFLLNNTMKGNIWMFCLFNKELYENMLPPLQVQDFTSLMEGTFSGLLSCDYKDSSTAL